ncbi:MAG TPA: PAS domain-containing protein, partial [Desulfobacteria bacterium]|nr:PAS domain-containing protein [Desulfobacteria bacterium]
MSRLAQVSESGQKVAEAIATVLKVDVELIDTDLVRVAGTGIIRYDVGTRLLRGLVNKHVLQTGNHIFINESGFHEICLSCPLTGQCFYKASIVYPITAGSETIGTISLIAFNDEQKETLGTNTDSLIEFIGRMADLIGTKALESEILTERMVMSNRLEAVVDSVDECVIAVNSEGFITHFNRSAERVFGIRKKQILDKDSKQILPTLPFWEVLQDGKGFNSREVFITYEGRKLHLLSTLKPIKLGNGQVVGVVGTFRDFKETQKLAYEIMSNQEMIVFEDIVGISKPMLEIKA